MATLNITEFPSLASVGTDAPQLVGLPPLATQNVTIAGASAASSAFSDRTRIIRVETDTACAIKVAETPVALTTDLRMVANTVEYFAVAPGQKIAVIT